MFPTFSYAGYSATGLLQELDDLGPKGWGNVLDNSASYTYDGLGRLVRGDLSPQIGTLNYGYDPLGNMTLKEGHTLEYGTNHPHTLEKLDSTQVNVFHDPNGNRVAKPSQSYAYDGDDHLISTSAGGQGVAYYYDYTGRKVADVSATNVTRYYSELAEVTSDGTLTKYYFAGGMRVAARRVSAPQLAGLPADPAVMLAQAQAGSAAVVLLVRDDLQRGVLLAIGIVGVGLLVAPWRRRRVVGVAVRYGHVIGVIIAFEIATLPLPIFVKPASAQTMQTLYHYHLDHLGSTVVVTGIYGQVVFPGWIRPRREWTTRPFWKAPGRSCPRRARRRTVSGGRQCAGDGCSARGCGRFSEDDRKVWPRRSRQDLDFA